MTRAEEKIQDFSHLFADPKNAFFLLDSIYQSLSQIEGYREKNFGIEVIGDYANQISTYTDSRDQLQALKYLDNALGKIRINEKGAFPYPNCDGLLYCLDSFVKNQGSNPPLKKLEKMVENNILQCNSEHDSLVNKRRAHDYHSSSQFNRIRHMQSEE